MIFGKKGSGKTTLLTKIALSDLKKGKIVYSTIPIPGTRLFNVKDVGFRQFEEGATVLIDEVGMIWDNRDFKSFKPEVRDYFKLQRQYKNKVVLFSQTFDIDLKLRNLTDEMWLLGNVARIFSIQRKITKKITISNASNNSRGVSDLVDEYKFVGIFGGIKITFIPRYIAFFNSYDPKVMQHIAYTDLKMTDKQVKLLNNAFFVIDRLKEMFKVSLSYFVKCETRFLSFIINKVRGPGGESAPD